MLKYPSKKGSSPDKYGLLSNLLARRVSLRGILSSYGRLLNTLCPGVGKNSHLVICGDSMVRFMKGRREFALLLVYVRAVGGALISRVQEGLEQNIMSYPPKITGIHFHAGLNNLSKSFYSLVNTPNCFCNGAA